MKVIPILTLVILTLVILGCGSLDAADAARLPADKKR
jgi:hypothetical protein